MKLLPFENIIFRTELSNEEIINRLNEVIEPRKKSSFRHDLGKAYIGIIKDSYFSVYRNINYWNSSLPRIKGILSGDKIGSTVKVKMRLSIFSIIFLTVWNVVLGIIFLLMLLTIIYQKQFNPIIFGPIGMIFLVYLITIIGFNYERKKSKNDFAVLLDCNIKKN